MTAYANRNLIRALRENMTYSKHRYAVTRVWTICYMSNLLHSIAIGKNIPLSQTEDSVKNVSKVTTSDKTIELNMSQPEAFSFHP